MVTGDSPIVALAVHNGHAVRDEVAGFLALDEADRLREEDPYTGEWTGLAANRMIGLQSRFEIDLNRPREEAVYRTPEDAWGLQVWKTPPPPGMFQRSLEEYDAFYRALRVLLLNVENRHGRFVVLDLHSYNHRRSGPDGPAADTEGNPQVNVGTGSMDRDRWAGVVDRFLKDLRGYPFPGGNLDVRENVKFRGRQVAAWVHSNFPETGCALAVEVKKFFMDEWTGERDLIRFHEVGRALASTVPGILDGLHPRRFVTSPDVGQTG
jgi:hypothetical protein